MPENPKNFLSDIHDKDYEKIFSEILLTNRGIIYDRFREKESLNGWWNFGIDQYDSCIRSKWYEEKYYDDSGFPLPCDYSFDRWELIFVPSCWNLAKEKYFLYEGSAVYTRRFRYVNRGEKRVFVKFGAVNYETKVFLNRRFIGMHKGGSTPFFIEITRYLENENRLLVVVNNTRKNVNIPAENTDWFNYGGIYRDVELIRLKETFIKDYRIGLVPGSGCREIEVEVDVDGTENCGKALVEIQGLLTASVPVAGGIGNAKMKSSPELWSADAPNLYDLRISYNDDVIYDRIGFREITVKGTEIYLNGKPVYLRGISIHEDSDVNGKTVSDDEIIENINIAKELNCNYIRLAHYPHTEKTAFYADKMGIMLWEEIPVYWAVDFDSNAAFDDAENQLSELILRDRNRASVIIWSMGNENPDTEPRFRFMKGLVDKARDLDRSRLISAACLVDRKNLVISDKLAECLDIIGLNEYYGWYEADFNRLVKIFANSNPSKPVVITEFGADALADSRGTEEDLGTEDCQAAVYKKQIDIISKIPYIKGMSPWILYDFRSPRRLHFTQNFYNIKGLLSADKKKKKLAYFILKNHYGRNIG